MKCILKELVSNDIFSCWLVYLLFRFVVVSTYNGLKSQLLQFVKIVICTKRYTHCKFVKFTTYDLCDLG